MKGGVNMYEFGVVYYIKDERRVQTVYANNEKQALEKVKDLTGYEGVHVYLT